MEHVRARRQEMPVFEALEARWLMDAAPNPVALGPQPEPPDAYVVAARPDGPTEGTPAPTEEVTRNCIGLSPKGVLAGPALYDSPGDDTIAPPIIEDRLAAVPPPETGNSAGDPLPTEEIKLGYTENGGGEPVPTEEITLAGQGDGVWIDIDR